MTDIKLLVRNINCPIGKSAEEAIASSLKRSSIKYESFTVYKKSIDARKKNNIKFVITALVETNEGYTPSPDITVFEQERYPDFEAKVQKEKLHPAIIGFGPCGMFAGLMLARSGYMPIIFEQGEEIDSRVKTVTNYLENGTLNPLSNIQFGEGGAGAFSDGKLITRVNDKRTSFILKTLVEHGAPEEILTQAKPHVGTDMLRRVVKSIRNEIISLGGEVHFSSKMTDIHAVSGGIEFEINNSDKFFAPAVFLATGHSSHDTYKLLLEKGFDIRGKDFSVGVRIEHRREDVERSLYGRTADGILPAAEYSVSYRENERGAYSFCMCPGGLVMASASDENSIVTNGMSYHARDEINSNSALAVSVLTSDYGHSAIKAIEYQRKLEKAAWNVAKNNRAPAQTVGDFLDGKRSINFTKVTPSYPHGVVGCDLSVILPQNISQMLKKGLRAFSSKHSFFADKSAILTGVETRTSSPVKIMRNEGLQAEGFENVYPCGEGAGWAGGITSAALDGLRVAERYILC